MSHHCYTPSLYNPTFVGAGWRCGKCGQRWMFYMPLQTFKVGSKYLPAEWRPVGRWRWSATYIDWTSICALVFSFSIVTGLYLWLG